MSIGKTIDELLKNKKFLISQAGKLIIEKDKRIEELETKLKSKQSEIDFLKGKISVYEKFLDIGVDTDE